MPGPGLSASFGCFGLNFLRGGFAHVALNNLTRSRRRDHHAHVHFRTIWGSLAEVFFGRRPPVKSTPLVGTWNPNNIGN